MNQKKIFPLGKIFKVISDVNCCQDHNSPFCHVQIKLKACLLEIEIQKSSSER